MAVLSDPSGQAGHGHVLPSVTPSGQVHGAGPALVARSEHMIALPHVTPSLISDWPAGQLVALTHTPLGFVSVPDCHF
ncbi:MAG: hypothetical protein KGI29_09825 [Pseudomonadota bacterium]|nr:hypothetical protein [Pseudomonadota bacterium]